MCNLPHHFSGKLTIPLLVFLAIVLIAVVDIAPDTVIESMSCTLRRYLDAGGKIVWYADIPMYYQGHVDGTGIGAIVQRQL